MQAKIAEAIDRLVNSEWPGVVAVSGGADSVALLRALHEIAPVGGLVVAHLNHQLRGEESDADEAFVQELAEQLGRTCRTKRVDVGLLSQKTGANLEATARSVRYQWLAEVAAEMGAMKTVRLAVAGAFHTSVMKPADEKLAKALADCQLQSARIPVWSNVDAMPHTDPAEIRALLVRQVIEPVLWEKTIRALLAAGVTTFVEIGPGRVLAGLMKRIERKADMRNVGS